MTEPTSALTLQLPEGMSFRPRACAEVRQAWRTSCPRRSIWEAAGLAGLIDCDPAAGRNVLVSPQGRALLPSSREPIPCT